MTAEIVVMNKSAVALAADSAVTITSKIFNSAEKLYMLIPGQPVALMIYNYSEFMQLPWETIVKKFRIYNGEKRYNKLEDYSNKFFEFLEDPQNSLYSDKQSEITFRKIVQFYLDEIINKIVETIRNQIERKGEKISEKEVSEIISHWINQYYIDWNKEENLYSDKKVKELFQHFEKKYNSLVKSHIENTFGNARISESDHKKIIDFIYSIFYKKRISEFHTGVVIAGFGEEELYPVCEEFIVENYFCNHLKLTKVGKGEIHPENTGMIISFAQKDVVINFLNGIHPDFKSLLQRRIDYIFNDFSLNNVDGLTNNIDDEKKETLQKTIEHIKKNRVDNLLEDVQSLFESTHTDSILSTVAVLPKDELARMAESLVNITSFMKRVSMDLETVGGPIDVAVISKKDGFIWIKRKHYFDKEYNMHFCNSSK